MASAPCKSWWELKEALFQDNMVNTRVKYIDEEGTEVPINTECEFQEALRLARKQGNRIRFILIRDDEKKLNRLSSKSKDKLLRKEVYELDDCFDKKDNYKCVKEQSQSVEWAPEWFVSYMKKFRRDLLMDIGSVVNIAVREALKVEDRSVKEYDFEKNKSTSDSNLQRFGSHYYYKSDKSFESPLNKPPQPSAVATKLKSKVQDKIWLDQIREERKAKQYAKMEKFRQKAFDKRQLDRWLDVPNGMQEEKSKTPKPSGYSKVYVTYGHDFGPTKPMKSSSFTSTLSVKKLEVLQPYALWFLLGNNGSVPWSNKAFLKCFYQPDEFEFEDDVISLPEIGSGVGVNVAYEVTPLKVGTFSFTCAVFDDGVEIGEKILCRFEVVAEELGMKIPKTSGRVTSGNKDMKEAQAPTYEVFDDKEMLARTQKKIKENIKTIMKRLDDIEVLNPESNSKMEPRKKEEEFKEEEVGGEGEKEKVTIGQKRKGGKKRKDISNVEFQTGVFDLLQNLETIRDNEEAKTKDDDKENPKSGSGAGEGKKGVNANKEGKQDESEKLKIPGQNEADAEMKNGNKKEEVSTEKRDSDSDLSVITTPEEEENFIVLSIPTRDASPEMEEKKVENIQKKAATPNVGAREEEKKVSSMSDILTVDRIEKVCMDQLLGVLETMVPKHRKKDFWESEEVKCMKISAAQFLAVVDRKEKERKEKEKKEKERKEKEGKDAESVDKEGQCVTVSSDENEMGTAANAEETQKAEETPKTEENPDTEKSDGTPGGSATDYLMPSSQLLKEKPDYNVHFYEAAYDMVHNVMTAFSNIHNIFGNDEPSTPRESNQPRQVSLPDALEDLQEMGFTDRDRNSQLLMMNNNDIGAVIDELLEGDQKPQTFRDTHPTNLTRGKFDRI